MANSTVNNRAYVRPPFNNSNAQNIIIWADLPNNLEISPSSGDLLRVTGNQAIEQSMENIILTYQYERPYSDLGTALELRLFENVSPLEEQMIMSAIRLSIAQYETRVKLIDLNLVVSPDANEYTLTIVYSVINNPQVYTFSMILQRNR